MANPGETLAERYTLTEAVSAVSAPVVHWLAQDSAGETVRVTVYENADENVRQQLTDRINSLRQLIHPAIVPVIAVEESASDLFLVSPGAEVVTPSTMDWDSLLGTLNALEYAHRLGFAHGYLSPDNIGIDRVTHQVRLFNFGLPMPANRWSSPESSLTLPGSPALQIRQDRFAIACAIHEAMTNERWQGKVSQDVQGTPLGHAVAGLIDGAGRGPDLAQLGRLVEGHRQSTTQLVPDSREHQLPHTRPTTAAGPELARGDRSIPLSWAIGGMVVIAVLAGFFAYISPGGGDRGALPEVRPAVAQPATASEATPTLTPLEQAKQERYQTEGREVADEILRLQVQLEDVGVTLWAADAWDRAQTLSERADEAFRDGRFEDAMTDYRATRELLEETYARRMDTLEQYLATGIEALEDGDHQRAIVDLSVVNAINPEHPGIDGLLERATNLEEAINLTNRGIALMSAQEYDAARDVLEDAIELDPNWSPAREARQQLEEVLQVIAFNDVMSAGFAAMRENDFDTARENFEAAAQIQPTSEAPAEALAQVSTKRQSSRVASLLGEAAKHEQAERWQEALKAYSAALDLDPTIVTAVSGVRLAQERISLDDDIQAFINHPIRLTTDDGLTEARRLLGAAARANPTGPRLRNQTDQLAAFISVARIPVEVNIESDRETDITIYKVSNLGRISSESMTLAPGAYTVVGKRRGYRDVRHELTLLGGQRPVSLYVACTEKVQP